MSRCGRGGWVCPLNSRHNAPAAADRKHRKNTPLTDQLPALPNNTYLKSKKLINFFHPYARGVIIITRSNQLKFRRSLRKRLRIRVCACVALSKTRHNNIE